MNARISLVATEGDLARISAQNPGWKIERCSNGELIVTPPTGGKSSKRNAMLTRLLVDWADAHGHVAFDSNGGFRLPDSSVVAADAALLPREQWEYLTEDEREGFPPLAPAVAVELCSRTDDPSELRAKLKRLREAGTAYAVLIDPYCRGLWTDGQPTAGFDVDFTPLLN